MWWIAIIVPVILLILFILFDKRKSIIKFKKKPKKDKKIKEIKILEPEIKQPIEKKEDIKDSENTGISFDKKVISEKIEPIVEEIEIEEPNSNNEYSSAIPQQVGRNPFSNRQFPPRRIFRDSDESSYFSNIKKKSIKKQINDLSPEMKAILMANIFGKKD